MKQSFSDESLRDLSSQLAKRSLPVESFRLTSEPPAVDLYAGQLSIEECGK